MKRHVREALEQFETRDGHKRWGAGPGTLLNKGEIVSEELRRTRRILARAIRLIRHESGSSTAFCLPSGQEVSLKAYLDGGTK